MSDATLPGGLDEVTFLETYRDETLRAPQVVADAILRALPFATPPERPALVAGIAAQLTETCLGLTLVFDALDSRRLPVARALLAVPPGPGAWRDVVQLLATADPEAVVRRLALDDAALAAARALRGRDLSGTLAIVEVFADGQPLLMPGAGSHFRLVSVRSSAAVELAATEERAVVLADLVADLAGAAQGLLDGYILARAGGARGGCA